MNIKFKEKILQEIEQGIKSEINFKKWERHESFLYCVVDSRKNFISYLGIRLVSDRDYVIPFVGWTRNIKIPFEEFALYSDGMFEEVDESYFDNISKITGTAYLEANNFGAKSNCSKKISPPDNDFFFSLKDNVKYVNILKESGIYEDFFTVLPNGKSIYQDWGLLEVFLGYEATEQDIKIATIEITEDIQNTLKNIFYPFLQKVNKLI